MGFNLNMFRVHVTIRIVGVVSTIISACGRGLVYY